MGTFFFLILLSWSVDPAQSDVRFTVTKFGREVVVGRFHAFSGTVAKDHVDLRVRVASVKTGDSGRDDVLQGPEFFDASRFPELKFVSQRVRPLPDGRIHVSGTMTIRGRARPLVITAREIRPNVWETRFVLNRHDFGVSGGSVSRHGISDTVDVQLRLAGEPQ